MNERSDANTEQWAKRQAARVLDDLMGAACAVNDVVDAQKRFLFPCVVRVRVYRHICMFNSRLVVRKEDIVSMRNRVVWHCTF